MPLSESNVFPHRRPALCLSVHWCGLEATDWFPVNREDIELPQDKIFKADLGPKLDHLQ